MSIFDFLRKENIPMYSTRAPKAVIHRPECVTRDQNIPRDDEVEAIFTEIRKVYCSLYRYAEMCANVYSDGLNSYGTSGKTLWEELQEIDELFDSEVDRWMSKHGVKHDSNGSVIDHNGFVYSPISKAKMGEYETRILPEIKKLKLDTEKEIKIAEASGEGDMDYYSGCVITPEEAKRFFSAISLCNLYGIYPIVERKNDGFLKCESGYNLDSLTYQIRQIIKQVHVGKEYTDIKIGSSTYIPNLSIYIKCSGTVDNKNICIGLPYWEGGVIFETESNISSNSSDVEIQNALKKIICYNEPDYEKNISSNSDIEYL